MQPSTPIKMLTWNISGYDISEKMSWNFDLETKWEHIGVILEDLHPDIMALQELPSRELAVVYGYRIGLTPVHIIETHAGFTALYIPNSWRASLLKIFQTESIVGCTVRRGEEIWGFAALHLAPGKNMKSIRQAQLQNIVDLFKGEVSRFVLAGDTNMRHEETNNFPNLNLDDLYRKMGSPPKEKWTWDSFLNSYHENGFKFRAQFDKILSQGWDVSDYRLIGNKPIEKKCYLSDHFGILILIKSN